ncbi:uncharacterized protein LOC134836032 [Culicoides brevitarsis]|uniref:uncharacterized protein LOC134836032 n=1 Tax=Culicoides brevitarsis TaxID=469753 RepID=UPI00307C3390
MRNKLFIACFTLVALFSSNVSMHRIYDNLIHCYRANETLPSIGASMRVLIELIAKLEDKIPPNIDLRHVATNIFHEMRQDGIERTPGGVESEFVTPYGATGSHIYKFNLLKNLISHTSHRINFANYLTKTEICYLHKLISTGVEPYIRGDEVRTCPVTRRRGDGTASRPDPFNRRRPHVNATTAGGAKNPKVLSSCPLELGAVKSEFGTVTPGTLIGAIAAGLQPQNVQMNDLMTSHRKHNPYEHLETMDPKDTRKAIEKLFNSVESVDNTFAAGLSGDLAEVCVFQSPILGVNVSVGMTGTWNSSYFPRWRYLPETHNSRWEMTDAEILAGIDSHFVAHHVKTWTNRIHRLRLSQILQMYYDQRYGIPSITIESTNNVKQQAMTRDVEEIDFDWNESTTNKVERFQKYINEISSTADGINRACHRQAILQTIDSEKLKEETYRFAQILQYAATSIVDDGEMRRVCDVTVDKFFGKARELTKDDECSNDFEEFRVPNVDVTLVIDGARPEYESQEFIFHLAEMLELSPKGSKLSIIHGMTGKYMVKSAPSIANVFEQLKNFTDPYPTRLSLNTALLSFIATLANQTETEMEEYTYGAPSHVLFVISQGIRMTQEEFDVSRRLMQSTLTQFPDLYYLFLTNNPETFREFEGISSKNQFFMIESGSTKILEFSKKLQKTLQNIPKRIISPYCKEKGGKHLWSGHTVRDHFEEFIAPQQEIRYRIHANYFSDNFQVQFQGLGYGEITVCMTRDGNEDARECRNVVDLEYNWFSFYDICRGNYETCENVYFAVTVDKSYVKCSEQDCRFPYQVKFLVKPVGLRCQTNAATTHANPSFKLLLFVQIVCTVLVLRLNKYF